MHLGEDHDVPGVVDGGGEQLGREGGHVDRDADWQPVSVLEARLALRCNLLADDVDVRKAGLLRACHLQLSKRKLSVLCAMLLITP